MTYLLDTNICIELLRPKGGSELIRSHIERVTADEIVLCSTTRFELMYGALRSKDRLKNLGLVRRFLEQFRSLPFDDSAADHAAGIRAQLAAEGTPIGPADIEIAAIARAHGLTLVTNNTREFSRVSKPRLSLEDWLTA